MILTPEQRASGRREFLPIARGPGKAMDSVRACIAATEPAIKHQKATT